MTKFNTAVPYKTPSHRNRYGQYVSVTTIKTEKIPYLVVTISLVWFHGLGWYNVVEMSGWKRPKSQRGKTKTGLGESIMTIECCEDHDGSGRRLWRRGVEVGDCAEAAEALAKKRLGELGILDPPPFEPYTLKKRY